MPGIQIRAFSRAHQRSAFVIEFAAVPLTAERTGNSHDRRSFFFAEILPPEAYPACPKRLVQIMLRTGPLLIHQANAAAEAVQLEFRGRAMRAVRCDQMRINAA